MSLIIWKIWENSFLDEGVKNEASLEVLKNPSYPYGILCTTYSYSIFSMTSIPTVEHFKQQLLTLRDRENRFDTVQKCRKQQSTPVQTHSKLNFSYKKCILVPQ